MIIFWNETCRRDVPSVNNCSHDSMLANFIAAIVSPIICATIRQPLTKLTEGNSFGSSFVMVVLVVKIIPGIVDGGAPSTSSSQISWTTLTGQRCPPPFRPTSDLRLILKSSLLLYFQKPALLKSVLILCFL